MMSRVARVQCVLIFLAFLVVFVQLWKLKKTFISNKGSTQELYLNTNESSVLQIRGYTRSGGRAFMWSSPSNDEVAHQDDLDERTLHNSGAQSPQRSVKLKTGTLLFAHGEAVKSYQSIMEASWVFSLQSLLNKMNKHQVSFAGTSTSIWKHIPPRNQVTVVVGNTNYTLSLLNWLVSAFIKTTPPLENVIVVCLDKMLYMLLNKKDIPSVFVDPETIIRGRMQTRSSHIWITRCAVYRLLNQWGYDVITYDTDAIVLKNLQPILDAHLDSDIVASSGIYPFQLGVRWGLTLCMGVILIRSTSNTEFLWNILGQTRNDTYDDQVKLNYALDGCNIKWFSQGQSIDNQAIAGKCTKRKLNGLKVTVLPQSLICRKCKQHKTSYYVWHNRSKRAGDMKMKTAIAGYTWFLKKTIVLEDGELRESEETKELRAFKWLKAISLL